MARLIGTALFPALLFTESCVSIPKNANAVKPFDADRYLGTWYEIARMDFRFEKNLDNVTAQYSRKNGAGGIEVRNRGRDTTTGNWKQSIGKAKLLGDANAGRLKVSFFGPFYSGYNVVAIDSGYRYALIAGDNLKYMWILSRTPDLPAQFRTDYLNLAQNIGYDTAALIWTRHTGAQYQKEGQAGPGSSAR